LYSNDPDVPEAFRGGAYILKAGNLGFSVGIFCGCATTALIVLYVRRIKCGGELGGPRKAKIVSSIFLVSLWGFYILMSILKIEEII